MRRVAGWILLFPILLARLDGAEIVCAFYNVQNYLPMDRRENHQLNVGATKPESEIAAAIAVIQTVRPDILGLAEMGGEAMLEDLQRRLKAAGLEFPHREWVQGADAERHVCLLSRFPIVSRNSVGDVPIEIDGRRERMNRGILDVTIEIDPAYRLRVVGAHLKSRRPVPEYDESVMRAREAWYLRDHVSKILAENPETNLLLFGDFNDTKNEYPVRELIGPKGSPQHMADLALKDSRGESWTHYWKTADDYSRIDYLLASRALMPEIVPGKCGINDSPFWNDASDHRAIYATISAKEAP